VMMMMRVTNDDDDDDDDYDVSGYGDDNGFGCCDDNGNDDGNTILE